MRRREFITLLGGVTAWVSSARAQEPRRVIGVLSSGVYGTLPGAEAAFAQADPLNPPGMNGPSTEGQ
jgi:hypothetical protein